MDYGVAQYLIVNLLTIHADNQDFWHPSLEWSWTNVRTQLIAAKTRPTALTRLVMSRVLTPQILGRRSLVIIN